MPARVPQKTRRNISKDTQPLPLYSQPTPASPPYLTKNAIQQKPLVSGSSECKGLSSKSKAEGGPGLEDESQASMFMRSCKNSILKSEVPHPPVATILESTESTAPVSESEMIKVSVSESKQGEDFNTEAKQGRTLVSEPKPGEPKQDEAFVSNPKPEANRQRDDALSALALGT